MGPTAAAAMFLSTLTSANSLANMPPLTKMGQHLPLAEKAMNYFDQSPDPFHAVQTSVEMLQEAGFEKLEDRTPYAGKLIPGNYLL